MDDLIDQIVDDWNDSSRQKADDEFWKNVESHPAFGTDFDTNTNLSPEVEALQALKFDSDSLENNVLNYKNEGNYYFKKKMYPLAIVNYTKALKLNVEDQEMSCILFTNRAACHFHQENYRRCINDCKSAIQMNPKYLKAYWRAAHAAAKVDKCDEVVDYCDKGLQVCPDNADLASLREKFMEKKLKQADSAKYQLKERSIMMIEDRLNARGVVIDEEMNSVEIPVQHSSPAFIDRDDVIHFNLLLLYPEHCQTDFLQDVTETATIFDCLQSIFSVREKSVDWDINGHYMIYTADLRFALQAFYENADGEMIQCSLKTSIKDLIQMKQYRLRPDLVVEINVVSRLSEKFLTNWKKTMLSNDLD